MEPYPILELSPGEFPPLLREIPDPPKKLYRRGILMHEDASSSHQDRKLLCVVGSRNYSSYGKEVVSQLIAGLREYPITIVSGLAIGIDGLAHTAALETGLHTIAVPGSGLRDEVLYPHRHKNLAHKILAAGGGLLSEYEPDFHAMTWSFTRRNRIMAGMSHATLIIEASEQSGTLVTARLAMEYNRDVLTVPGSIFSKNSYGPHMLIRDGATPITSATDILEALGLKERLYEKDEHFETYSKEEQQVLKLLNEPLGKDALIRALDTDTSSANILLTMMELKGLIQEDNGKISANLRKPSYVDSLTKQ